MYFSNTTLLQLLTTYNVYMYIQTRELVSAAPQGYTTPGLVSQPLSQEQWATLDKVNEALTKEYTVRRQMLLTRCDVTIQSFRWCDRAKVYIASSSTLIPCSYIDRCISQCTNAVLYI